MAKSAKKRLSEVAGQPILCSMWVFYVLSVPLYYACITVNVFLLHLYWVLGDIVYCPVSGTELEWKAICFRSILRLPGVIKNGHRRDNTSLHYVLRNISISFVHSHFVLMLSMMCILSFSNRFLSLVTPISWWSQTVRQYTQCSCDNGWWLISSGSKKLVFTILFCSHKRYDVEFVEPAAWRLGLVLGAPYVNVS